MLRNDLYRPWFLENDKWGFEIISGDYQGVVIQIEKIAFKDDNGNPEEPNLDVEYNIINKPELLKDEDLKTEMFKSTFEMIVSDIITEAIQNFENAKDRNDDPKESDSQ